MQRTSRLTTLALLILAAALAVPAAAAERIDPFYLRLLRDGEAQYERGEIEQAARDLRLACFGTLDDPPLLARCLVQLAMAQAKLGDRRAFDETVTRLLEAEERLDAYSSADLPESVAEEFRAQVDAWVPEETLRQYPVFAPLVERKRAARLAGLSSSELAAELQHLLVIEPEQPRWRLMLARLELDRGDDQAALGALGGMAPEVSSAIPCLRGQALSRLQRCPEAIPELERCVETPVSGPLQEALLGCRVELGLWQAASEQLAVMTADLRGRSGVERLVRRLDRQRPEPAAAAAEMPAADPRLPAGEDQRVAEATAPEGLPAPAADPGEPADQEPGEAGNGSDIAPEDPTRGEVVRLRQRLAEVRTAPELEATFETAQELAGRPGAARETFFLAAEIAYRLSRWDDVVRFFDLGGGPGDESPDLLFYLAVALYERGDAELAAATLERCLPRLKATPFVESYRVKILGS